MELDRVTVTDGIVFYRSPSLARVGVPHGFSTRLGGVSPAGPFASMNLGNPNGCPVQDDRANLYLNYDLLHAAVGCSGRPRAFVWQVHGGVVASARAGQPFDTETKADAVVTDDPSRMASIRTADCVPILLSTHDGRVVAAVHAGWRGVAAGVVVRAAEAVRAVAAERAKNAADRRADDGVELFAAIGPSIGFDAFEVGPEVAATFEERFGGDAATLIKPAKEPGKALIDLRAALRIQLIGVGVAEDAIDATDRCTFRDADEFFSHRRENGVTGRMAAIVGPI